MAYSQVKITKPSIIINFKVEFGEGNPAIDALHQL